MAACTEHLCLVSQSVLLFHVDTKPSPCAGEFCPRGRGSSREAKAQGD